MSVAEQARLSLTWLQTPKTVFFMTWLKWKMDSSNMEGQESPLGQLNSKGTSILLRSSVAEHVLRKASKLHSSPIIWCNSNYTTYYLTPQQHIFLSVFLSICHPYSSLWSNLSTSSYKCPSCLDHWVVGQNSTEQDSFWIQNGSSLYRPSVILFWNSHMPSLSAWFSYGLYRFFSLK